MLAFLVVFIFFLVFAFLFADIIFFGAEAEYKFDWKPEGDCDGANWHRYKMERWERERRETDRRARNMQVENERRSGLDRRKREGHMFKTISGLWFYLFRHRKMKAVSYLIRTYRATQNDNRLIIHTPFYDVQWTYKTTESARAARNHIRTHGVNCSEGDMRRMLRNF